MKQEHFTYYKFYHLEKGDVFKWRLTGAFHTVLSIDKESALIQNTFGKSLNNQKIDAKFFNRDVVAYPDRKRKLISE
jgi:hypothetical protein